MRGKKYQTPWSLLVMLPTTVKAELCILHLIRTPPCNHRELQ